MNTRLIDVALGRQPADAVIKGGILINVHSAQIYHTDIAIADGRIASIGPLPESVYGQATTIIDAAGMYLAPGFIDAHIHIESSMLTYTEFAKMVVRHGTTAVASDLMEVTIVSGVEGMKEVLRESETTPVRLYYPVPAFMEESHLQTTGSTLYPEMMEELIQLPQAVGLAEVLGMPLLAGSPASAAILALARAQHKTVEGHAPALRAEQINAFAGAGINSEHESTTKEEALMKVRVGMRVLMREGSASTDLLECLRAITEEGADARRCSMVSDDIDALHIKQCGHLDHKVRLAIRAGIDPITAIRMVSLHPAENFFIDHECGSIAPGRVADVVFLSSLEDCRVERVMVAGEMVVEQGCLIKQIQAPEYSGLLMNTIHLKRKATPEDMVITLTDQKRSARVHVIGASSVSLLTEALEADLPVRGGVVEPDVANDVLRIACVERYGKHGGIGRSFVKGFGLREGAIAISVGHDHHNITVVGSDPADMAIAVNRIDELQGGFVLVNQGEVLYELALPICGLLSPDDGEAVADRLSEFIQKLETLGCRMPSPNVTLSFITLIFIPKLAISDLGLFDVTQFKLIAPVISST